MKHSSVLGLFTCVSLLAVSASALAAPGDATPKKKRKPKSAVSADAPKPDATASAAPTTTAPATGAPVAPETKAADSSPPQVTPQPVATASVGNNNAHDRPSDSNANDDFDSSKAFSAAPLLGFGSNHFGFGAGARAGYTFPMKLYVGASFMYYFGSSYDTGFVQASSHVLSPSAEVGYDLHVGQVTIRPYGGVGIAFVSSTVSIANGPSASASTSSMMLYPGATVYWNIPRSDFFVGGDARMVLLTRGGDPSFDIFATAGIKF